MNDGPLRAAIETVPPGAWAVGVSGGADSVALLALLRARSDLRLVVAHLDHETRGGASAADAEFVRSLAQQWSIPIVAAQRREIEARCARLPSNVSAQFRAIRIQFFGDVVRAHDLQGVILAHHADDQAETIFLRLLRGAGATGLAGMAPRTVIRGVAVWRPLLGVRRALIRDYLNEKGIVWREDATNVSAQYRRNRVRRVLTSHPHLHEPLIALASCASCWRAWLRDAAPRLPERFALTDVRALPEPVRRESLRLWLAARGVAPDEVTPAAVARLSEMIDDAASPPRQQFPSGLLVRRRAGQIFVDGQPKVSSRND